MTSMTLRIADELKDQLDVLAEATGRTRSFLVIEAIHAYLQQEAWQVAEIKLALQEADAGDFAEENQVAQIRSKWLGDAG